MKQQPLTLAIIMSLSITLSACGGGGTNMTKEEVSSSLITRSTPHVIQAETEEMATEDHRYNDTSPSSTTTPSQPTTTTSFHSTEPDLISVSTSRESTYTGIDNGFSIAPVSNQDRQLIKQILDGTNTLRKEKGLPPLKYDENLAAYAQQRANEIVLHYAHEHPDGSNSLDDAILVYKKGGAVGENIYKSPRTPEAAVKGWKKSSGHYQNMVNAEYNRIGIGLVRKPDTRSGYYWTQIFAGGDVKTKYHFDPQLMTKQPALQAYLAEHVNENQSTSAISLVGGNPTNNNAQAGYHQGILKQAIYQKNKRFVHDGFAAVIQDPTNTGFSYQTFGEIVDRNNIPVQYVNIGRPYIPNDDVQFQATYHGSSLGNRNQHSHYYADVTARVDYGPQRKIMDIAFSHTRFAPNDITDNNPNASVYFLLEDEHSKNYNFKEQLTWDSEHKRFDKTEKNGNHIHAAFYGKHGEEIGGQFTRIVSGHEIYEGVFAAKNNQDAAD